MCRRHGSGANAVCCERKPPFYHLQENKRNRVPRLGGPVLSEGERSFRYGCCFDTDDEGEAAVLKNIFYTSRTFAADAADQICPILDVSRRNNRRAGVTGFLLFDGKRFLQFLEGPAAAVDATMHRIVEDRRHYAHVIMIDEEETHRQFPDWDMAFENEGELRDTLLLQVERRLGTLETRAARLFRSYAKMARAA